MKLPNMTTVDSFNEVSVGTSQMNGRSSSRSGSTSSLNGRRRKGESIADAVVEVVKQNGKTLSEGSGRFSLMKKAANEQRNKVRETRERLIEEKLGAQIKRQEELRLQIQAVLNTLLEEVKKEVLVVLEERIAVEEKQILVKVKEDLLNPNSSLACELKKRVTNGESLESRVIHFKREFDNNYSKSLRSELAMIQTNILAEVDDKIETEKCKWESIFRRETMKRVNAAEDAIRTDFRVGLEDSQKHCNEILTTTQKRTLSLEDKLTNKIAVIDTEVTILVRESEQQTCQLVAEKLEERDKYLRNLIRSETEELQKEIIRYRKEIAPKSKCCAIL